MKKWLKSLTILTVLFLIFGIFIQSVYADKEELEKIKKAIKEKGAKWTAGETSLSKLTDEEMKLRLGAILPDVGAQGAVSVKGVVPLSSGTEYVNWDILTENPLMGDYVTPIKDQDGCGSCWAFGAIAELESVWEIYYTDSSNKDFSEQYLVSCVTNCCSPNPRKCGGCSGCNPNVAYEFLKTTGAPSESCFPYQAMDYRDGVTCPTNCSDSSSLPLVKIASWSPVSQDVEALKTAVDKHPISAGLYVYRDFSSYKGGVYEHVPIRRKENPLGGHVICIIGYDDTAPYSNGYGCFIGKNSWGSGSDTYWWGEDSSGKQLGERGFFRIAYSQVTNEVAFGCVAGDFAMDNLGKPAPPKTAKSQMLPTLWGRIKSTY